MYKFFVFAPRNQKIIQKIIDAASDAEAGKIGNYKGCAFITEGTGTWYAEKGANPAIGKVGKTERVDEVKIEMECPKKLMQQIINAIKSVHPYEEVAIDVFPMERFK